MFQVLDPQPRTDDISFFKMVWNDSQRSWGLHDPNSKMEGEFIPLPEGINPSGITVIKRNHLWFWTRPAYFNLNNPRDQITETLESLGIFSEKQQALISNCLGYDQNQPAGLPGHELIVLVGRLYVLLSLALTNIDDKDGVVEAYQVIMGEHHDGK